VQVDPIKPTLKAPGIKLFKLEHDKPLSIFGSKFNLRRYIVAGPAVAVEGDPVGDQAPHSAPRRVVE
jgi:hypothetical protein